MSTHNRGSAKKACVALLAALVICGCSENPGWQQEGEPQPAGLFGQKSSTPTPDEVARMLEPNVLGVSCFYDPLNPWLWNTDHTRVRGLRISALYLRGPNYTGVFGDGVIRPKLFVAYRDEEGAEKYRLVKEWEFDVEAALPFRAKRRMRAGWGYGLFLDWDDLDLSGRSIRLIVQFERADGIVISGSKKDFRFPRPDST